jgi:glycosyltransferase involved in cell wall biosynthesis
VDIAVIRSNSILYSPRVRKIVKSLNKRYRTLALGWNREGLLDKSVTDADIRLFNLKAPFGKRILVAYFFLYWTWILIKLSIYRPSVVHACDLDSAIPSYIYKTLFKKKMVFDVCDRYAMAYIPTKFKTIYTFVNSLEELIGSKSDMLINVSEALQKSFSKKLRRSAIIMNCSDDHIIDKKKLPEDNGILTLVYTGIIIRSRGLKEVALAIKDLKHVNFIIAGRPIDQDLKDELVQMPNIEYKGLLSHNEALELQSNSHVMISLYDLKDPISNFSMGNKIFEAMMFGLPVITNVSSELISGDECGIIVDYNDIDQIKAAITNLRDDLDLRRRLGNNGRDAFLNKYNWAKMEQELYKIYDGMLNRQS